VPNDAAAYNLLERAYFGLRRWDDAQAAGERAVALAPSNSDYHLWLGRTYGEKADQVGGLSAAFLARKARQEFERAVALDASNLDARTDLAEFYLEAPSFLGGGKDKALQQAQTIATRDQATAHWVSARIAEKEKKYDLAEQEYKASIQASRDDKANFWLNLASFYKRRGRLNDMEDAISQAMVANRKKPNVLLDAATLLFRAGRNFPAAIDAIRRYLSNTVEDGPAYEAHYVLGAILEKQGDKQAAAAEYRAALSLASEFGLAQAALRRLGQ
jgi:tetratricopeptide (TPR) repeat protein